MTDSTADWYAIKNIDEMDSPALVVYKDRVVYNIRQAISMVSDIQRLRPHVKTHKSAEVAKLMLEAGIQKFKCATIAEAEMLASVAAPDVLLAYQPVGPKVDRLIQLIKKYPATLFSCLVDNKEIATSLNDAAQAAGLTIPVYIDLNVGMNRTGIIIDQATDLHKQLQQLPAIEVKGLHMYDGHIRHADMAQRTAICNATFEKVNDLKTEMEAGGASLTIIAGGTTTFPIHAKRPHVECGPGTFVYWDSGYATTCSEQPFIPAALVITRIISLPDARHICTDLGHKSIASENELAKRVSFLHAPDLKPTGQSEEHLVLEVPMDHEFKVGDVLYGWPYHICPTCALYERSIVVENGIATTEWKHAARDRKIFV